MSNTTHTKANQSAINQLIATNRSSSKFSDLLLSMGYSTMIENITLNIPLNRAIDFSDCQFTNVTFTGGLPHSTFNHTSFNNVRFENADLSSSIFDDVTFNYCTLTHSKFTNALFNQAVFSQDNIYDCDFSNSSFAESTINKTVFAKSKFDNTLDHQNILAESHLVFNQQYHYDYVFQNAQTHIIKPTVVILDDPEWHSQPYYILETYGANPITIDQNNFYINDSILAKEVKNVIDEIKLHGLNDNSIAEQVINSNQPIINAIKEYAYQIMDIADGLWIPGGPDLHPEFYNEPNNESYPSYSYYREILEFSLSQAAITMDKPILGVCHGSQLMNVYLGGTLYQHVDTPYGYVTLQAHKKEGLIGSVIEDNLIGPSYHHQAVKDIAKSLEVVATHDGIIKATQATDGKKIMLCQFHPENEADQSSINILNQFVNISSDQKIKSTMIKLSDVIELNNEFTDITSTHDNNLTASPQTPYLSNFSHIEQLTGIVESSIFI